MWKSGTNTGCLTSCILLDTIPHYNGINIKTHNNNFRRRRKPDPQKNNTFMNKLKLFALALLGMATLSANAVDYSQLNYNGENEAPAGYKYYSSSSGVASTTAWSTLSDQGVTCFDVTGGGTGAYNKRSMEFTLTEDCSVEIELHTGNAGRLFSLYNNSATAIEQLTLAVKNQFYTFIYEFKGATEAQPQTYSISGSGSKVYISKITFTPAAPVEEPIIKGYKIAEINAVIDAENKTITAELPYGTNKNSAIDAALVTLGGTATSYSYNADKTAITVTDGTNTTTYTLNITIGEYKCGEIIRAHHTGATTATISGAIGGTVEKNTQSGGKLGSNGHYIGLKLANGYFMSGDKVTVVAEVASATLELFTDKGQTLIASIPEGEVVVGENTLVIPQTTEWIYLYRNSSAMNPTVTDMFVTRACDNTITAFTIGGVEATIDEENKTITAELAFGTELTEADWNNAYTAAGPDAANVTYGANHATITVGETTYTISITIATAKSEDASLKSITVGGQNIELTEGENTYTVVLPYGTTEPAVIVETNDATATYEVTDNDNIITITVTAQASNTAVYTVTYSIADAPKVLLEALFSNGVKGFINNTELTVNVPYMKGTEQPTFVSGKAETEGMTVSYADGKILVPGIDDKTGEFTVIFQEYAPAEIAFNTEYTFDGEEIGTWVASVYGWDSDKGMKFSKNVEEASNRRISEGKTRIYIFVPACDNVLLTSISTTRDIKLSVNGVVSETSTKDLNIPINNVPTMIGIESNQTKGDGGFVSIQLVRNEKVDVTGIELDQTTANMTVGETLTLTATVTPEDATNKNIIWTSSNEEMATVKDGVVTALAATGYDEVVITATTEDGNFSASCSIYIYPAIENISFNTEEFDTTVEFEEGLQLPLPLLVEPYDANTTGLVITSSNESVITITEETWFGYTMYNMNIMGVGEATITATAPNGKTATITITVIPAKIHATEITLNQTEITLAAGTTYTLVAALNPADAEDILTWSSSNEDVATVNDGIVTAVKVGTAYITVTTDLWVEAYCKVTVTDKETGIENINAELNLNAPIYNVLGEQVDTEYKGIVIQNGQKFLLQ